jgi:hypothetical protein
MALEPDRLKKKLYTINRLALTASKVPYLSIVRVE